MEFQIRLPGSTANLGPGYDVLGLALGIYNHIAVCVGEGESLRVQTTGPGCEELPSDGTNLFFTSALVVADRLGKPLPAIEAQARVNVPLARGLGSSSTAIIGGVVAANHILGNRLSRNELLDIAAEIEGHPDNVSPCLLGGFTVSTILDGHVTCIRSEPNDELKTVVVVPDFQLKTKEARSSLPNEVSHEDATFNVGRACVVTAAMLQGNIEALATAMEDRLHQPHRAHLIPHYDKVIAAGKKAGALGIALSGAGPTLLAIARENEQTIGEAMAGVWKTEGIESAVYALPIDTEGTVIL
ncbi:MAG: homoserine kinase [Candidatus Latescibacterota bacterium]|nr:homoserine kinase [Candidatus Latescibacterota bacterium]